MTPQTIGFRPHTDDLQRIQHIGSKLTKRCRGALPKFSDVIRAALKAASELAATGQLETVLDESARRCTELSRPRT